MKYLFFLIFSLNIIFYIFLIYKPLNIESDFSIEEGNNLNEIFASLEEKNIYFPKAIKLIFNVSGIDKKIYLGKYKIDVKDSLIDIFKNIYCKYLERKLQNPPLHRTNIIKSFIIFFFKPSLIINNNYNNNS